MFCCEFRVIKMFGLVVGVFVLCWGLFFLIVVLYVVCLNCFDDYGWVNISKWFYYVNSIFNFLVYMFFMCIFWSVFWCFIVCGLCCKMLFFGGMCFNLNIWKVGSVELIEMLKIYREIMNVYWRIIKENIGEMIGYMEYIKSIEGIKFC